MEEKKGKEALPGGGQINIDWVVDVRDKRKQGKKT